MSDQQRQSSVPPVRIFTAGGIFQAGAGFVAFFLLLNRLLKLIDQNLVYFDRPPYWPISIFLPRLPNLKQTLVAVAVAAFFLVAVFVLSKIKYRLAAVILAGVLLVLGTNLIQGYQTGFVIPIAAGGEKGGQYFSDALKVGDARAFLSNFAQLQPGLKVHSRTHPPGAVLLFYGLRQLGFGPVSISILLALASTILSAFFLYRIFYLEYRNDELPGQLIFLFLLIPAVQIYYAASLDALIAGLLTGALYFILHPRPAFSIIGSIGLIGLASLLTFGVVFILPVMIGYELWRNKSLWRSALVLVFLVLCYLATYGATHFNYPASFLIASRLENPHGFYLLANPASYFFTRLEGICEIGLFLGPFLGWALLKGLGSLKPSSPNLSALTWLGALALAAMFLTGAFHTGETARACLFIYPYLFFPVAAYLQQGRLSLADAKILPALVFFQSLFMQMFGFYFW